VKLCLLLDKTRLFARDITCTLVSFQCLLVRAVQRGRPGYCGAHGHSQWTCTLKHA
jgi:hypothetical protein